ncbi:MAG TPA: ATP phosphoribosyltransferase regulatory subunit [Polyangiaceae bacterium]|nr:ATP phosphoribosyltransferase regulatory subunit [Polyangiaceae bacterium]
MTTEGAPEAGAGGRAGELLLPVGMRDVLGPEAWTRRGLSRAFLEHVALHGYDLVSPPTFERAAVLELGLDEAQRDELLRFVEPESGAVLALRPDMTPQIARVVATRLGALPGPLRLAYEGAVLRRRLSRSRQRRQMSQAGFELVGVRGPEGDLEVLSLAASSLRQLGVERFVVDVGHAAVAGALLAPYEPARAGALREALSRKDEGAVRELARAPGVAAGAAEALGAIVGLQGGAEVLGEAGRVLGATAAGPALGELRALAAAAGELGLGPRLRFDLGEVRGLSYYTGPMFHLFAEGAGVPVGGGGRYDELFGRFGAPRPAAGAALDLEAIEQARRASGSEPRRPFRRVAVAPGPGALALAEALRARGVGAATGPEGAGLRAFARAQGYEGLLEPEPGGGWAFERLDTGARVCQGAGVEGVAARVEAELRGGAASPHQENACPP